MAVSKKSLNEKLRARYMEMVGELLTKEGEEFVLTASNEYAIPCVDENGDDSWVVLTFKVPTGSRDGDPYDGYSVAEDYAMKQTAKAEKAKETARKKAEKIAKDKADREARAKAKAEHQKGEA